MATKPTIVVGALCVAWYALSSASNVASKLALSVLPFPLTLATVQLAAVCVCSAPALAACGLRRAAGEVPLVYWWRVLAPLALAKVLTTLCSQISLWKVPVSYAHTVKATTPLWTAILARVLFGERQTRAVQAALVLIAAGVAIASATELQFEADGLAAALAAAALLALQHLYSKQALRDTGVHPLKLLAELSRLALVMVAPVWLIVDGLPLLNAEVSWSGAGPLVVASGVLAWLQAVVAFSVLSRVSPLTYAVASAAKRAVVVLASLVVLQNPAPPLNLAGMALAVAGVFAYNRARLRRDPKPRLLPM